MLPEYDRSGMTEQKSNFLKKIQKSALGTKLEPGAMPVAGSGGPQIFTDLIVGFSLRSCFFAPSSRCGHTRGSVSPGLFSGDIRTQQASSTCKISPGGPKHSSKRRVDGTRRMAVILGSRSAARTKPKPMSRRKGGFAVHKNFCSSIGAQDSHGSFRDTAKAISQINCLHPVKVFFALKGQLNISAEQLGHIVGIAPRTLLRRKQEGRLEKRGIRARRSTAAII